MQGVLLAVLYPLRWLAYHLGEEDPPAPSPASLQLPVTRRNVA